MLQVWAQAEAADAWLNKVGSPAEAAAWVQQDPVLRLGQQLRRHLPDNMAGWLQHYRRRHGAPEDSWQAVLWMSSCRWQMKYVSVHKDLQDVKLVLLWWSVAAVPTLHICVSSTGAHRCSICLTCSQLQTNPPHLTVLLCGCMFTLQGLC
jgi:hypothetical protein